MPPVRVVSEKEATSILNHMGYVHTAESDGRHYYHLPSAPDAPVVLDFGAEPAVPYYLLYHALSIQGEDADRFGELVRRCCRWVKVRGAQPLEAVRSLVCYWPYPA